MYTSGLRSPSGCGEWWLYSAIVIDSVKVFCHPGRKLTPRQKELVTEFAKTENFVDGTVEGVDSGQ